VSAINQQSSQKLLLKVSCRLIVLLVSVSFIFDFSSGYCVSTLHGEDLAVGWMTALGMVGKGVLCKLFRCLK